MNTAGRCQNDMQGAPVRPARAREAFRSIDEERRQQGGAELRESGGGVREEANVQYRRQSRPCAGSSVPEVGRAEAVKHESGWLPVGKVPGINQCANTKSPFSACAPILEREITRAKHLVLRSKLQDTSGVHGVPPRLMSRSRAPIWFRAAATEIWHEAVEDELRSGVIRVRPARAREAFWLLQDGETWSSTSPHRHRRPEAYRTCSTSGRGSRRPAWPRGCHE
jgi:hypothetical protein